MTRRRIIFSDKSTGKLYATPEFNGDKAEFDHFFKGHTHHDTCDKSWEQILNERFAGIKTLEDFVKASDAAQMDYHSFLGIEIRPVEQIENAGAISADEVFYIYPSGSIRKMPTQEECNHFNEALQAYNDIDNNIRLEKYKITYAEYQALGFILDSLRFDGVANVIQEGIKLFFERFGMKIERDKNGIGWMVTR